MLTPGSGRYLFGLAAARDKHYVPLRASHSLLTSLERAKVIQSTNTPGAFFLNTETLGRPFHLNSSQDENSKFIKGGVLGSVPLGTIEEPRCI